MSFHLSSTLLKEKISFHLSSTLVVVETATDEAVAPRRPRKEAKQRGRPRGSKNKQKEVTTSSSALVNDETNNGQ